MTPPAIASQIAAYREKGFAGPIPVLTAAEVAEFRDSLESFERSTGKPLDYPERSKPYLLFDWADKIVHHRAILDVVEAIIGPDILVYHTTMHIKEAASEAVVLWHQDDDYFHLSPAEQITAWVALSDATEQAGCMRMVPGSFREGLIAHDERPSPNQLIRLGKGIYDRYRDDEGEPVPVPAGHMSLHHTHAVHSSGPNNGTDRRIGIGISYIPTRVKPIHHPYSSALLVRGNDRFHHFHPETRLVSSLTPAARTAHSRAYDFYMKATGIEE